MTEEDDLIDELEELGVNGDRDPFELLAEGEEFTEAGGELDEDAVWERFAQQSESIDPGEIGEAVVQKSNFCQQCEYFSAPPAVSCGHAGTEIVELVDSEHFRVVNCPVVARRREIGEFE